MSTDDGHSDDENLDKSENGTDRSDSAEKKDSDVTTTSPSQEIYSLSNYLSNIPTSPVISPSLFDNAANLKKSMKSLLSLSESVSDLAAINAFNQPILDPKIIKALNEPVVDPQVIETLTKSATTLETLREIEHPIVDPSLMETLSKPAIDPTLINTLQSLNQEDILGIYKFAAALEQVEQQSPDEDEDILSDEPPQSGGFLSIFFNVTAAYLLHGEESLSDDVVNDAVSILQTENVQLKAQILSELIVNLGKGGVTIIRLGMHFGFQVAYSLHFAQDTSPDNDESD